MVSRVWAFLRQADWLLLFAAGTLLSFGLAALYSITLANQDPTLDLVKKQLLAIALGALLFLFVVVYDYRFLRSYSFLIYGASVLSLVAVLFFGTEIRGTTGWFSLGGFHFQPVEFAKLALIIILAHYFSDRARRDLGWRECAESGILALVPVGLTLLQPDLGSAMLLIGTWGVFVMFAGIKKRVLLVFVLLGILGAVIGWQFLAPYQKARLTVFIDPSSDAQGKGYNVRQAIIAVGSGEWFGTGLGFGSQSQLKFIPESQTDFIFAVIAEELGFVGVLFVLAAAFLLCQRILYHASKTRDDFTSYLLIGIGTMLFLQFCVNLGMNLKLLPVTGLALPLVSYGGSSLILTLLMLGIVEGAAMRSSGTRVVLART